MFIFRLVGNSLEIGCKTKMRFLERELEKFSKKIQVISGKKWVSGHYLGSFRVIRGIYRDNLPVIYIYA